MEPNAGTNRCSGTQMSRVRRARAAQLVRYNAQALMYTWAALLFEILASAASFVLPVYTPSRDCKAWPVIISLLRWPLLIVVTHIGLA